MSTEDNGGPEAVPWMMMGKPGDDIRGLPTGDDVFAGTAYKVADPKSNRGRVAIAVSHRQGLPPSVDVPVNATAGSLYLLHTSTKPGSENVCGSVAFNYQDGTRHVQYVIMGRQLTYWWFPELKTESSGIAWHGPSPVAADVGLSWCVIDNPSPEKKIASIRIAAPEDDGIYTVLGLTLADRPHYVPPSPVSFGGPNDWAAATAMAAMIEGLAGVKDGPLSQTYSHPVVAPRWDSADSHPVSATVRYPASRGYVSYWYANDTAQREIEVTVTGSATSMDGHFLLPPGVEDVRSADVDGGEVAYRVVKVSRSTYVDLVIEPRGVRTVRIKY
jgi:hypothetical protein